MTLARFLGSIIKIEPDITGSLEKFRREIRKKLMSETDLIIIVSAQTLSFNRRLDNFYG